MRVLVLGDCSCMHCVVFGRIEPRLMRPATVGFGVVESCYLPDIEALSNMKIDSRRVLPHRMKNWHSC